MTTWSKLLNYVAHRRRSGIALDESAMYEIDFESVTFPVFLRHLPGLVPAEAVLYLEGAMREKELIEFLENSRVEHAAKVRAGAIWPSSYVYHVPVTDETMGALAELSNARAISEICDHLIVYKDDLVLLEGYDIADRAVRVSKLVAESRVERFCLSVSCSWHKAS